MIRINLSSLAAPKTKRSGKRPSSPAPSMPGEGSSTVVLILVFVLVLGVAIGGSYMLAKRESARLEREWANALKENQRLAEVKAQYEASKRKADMFERRVKVIDDLKEAQKGPVNLL